MARPGVINRVARAKAPELELIELVDLEWLGRSVKALFMVNKELSRLAAVHQFEVRPFPLERKRPCTHSLFQTVKAGRCTTLTFRFRILPLYSSHVREVDFDSKATPEAFLSALSYLLPTTTPNLHRLTISRPASLWILSILGGSSSDPSIVDQAAHVQSTMSSLATRIDTLTLGPLFQASSILQVLPAIRHPEMPDWVTLSVHEVELAEALAQFALLSLRLSWSALASREAAEVDERWLSNEWRSVGVLRSLVLEMGSLTAGH